MNQERGNPYYAWMQSLRSTSRAEAWRSTFEAMLNGQLAVGSRQPVADLPSWVTLEVLPGGFASGKALAAGPLEVFEEELALDLDMDPEACTRLQLNAHFLTPQGRERLEQWLDRGTYRVEVPEEGALLVVAWLLRQGKEELALQVLEATTPYMDRLRFYPRPADHERPGGPEAFLRSVDELRSRLLGLQTPTTIEIEREALTVWQPFYERLTELMAETLEGDPPWPFQTFPSGWQQRAQQLWSQYQQMRKLHPHCHRKPKGNRRHLLEALQVVCQDPKNLKPRQVGMVARVLQDIAARRGVPLRADWQARRQEARAQILQPSPAELAPALLGRLKGQPGEHGLIDPEAWLYPLSSDEACHLGLSPGKSLPGRLRRMLTPCKIAPLTQLVQEGILGSAEVLAQVLPQVTGQLQAEVFAEPTLRNLYSALYQAFRRRRSLLLLNLEHQVRLHELPWIAALKDLPRNPDAQGTARRALVETLFLGLNTWPQQPFPNKLLQELEALSRLAGLPLPIVEELAADIFMGRFTSKFAEAANLTVEFLQGRLYQIYFDLPLSGRFTGKSFGELCMARAGVSGRSFRPAVNGTILEQAQILTSHNLATFCAALQGQLQLPSDLSQRCYEWILAELQRPAPDAHSRLIRRKNCAAAWRQMVFFLSLVGTEEVAGFLEWAARRPVPYLEGLRQAASGARPSLVWLGWEA